MRTQRHREARQLLKVIRLVSLGTGIQTQTGIIPGSSMTTTVVSQEVILFFPKVLGFPLLPWSGNILNSHHGFSKLTILSFFFLSFDTLHHFGSLRSCLLFGNYSPLHPSSSYSMNPETKQGMPGVIWCSIIHKWFSFCGRVKYINVCYLCYSSCWLYLLRLLSMGF